MFFSTKIILFDFTLKLGGRMERPRHVSSGIWIHMHMYVYACVYLTVAIREVGEVMRDELG